MKETIAKVEGMRCGMCEAHVCDLIRKNFDVKKVTASHVKNEAVILSEQPIDKTKLREVISKDGYNVSDITCGEHQKKGIFSVFKKN